MIHCCFVGPIKDVRLKDLVFDFHRRSQKLWPFTILEVPEDPKDLRAWITAKSGKGDWISLDAHGKSMDSTAFCGWVTAHSRDLYFMAWGADGPPKGLELPAAQSISLSTLTFNHEVARFILVEQLYRAGALLRGHPYPR
ncbi:MAG TPA: 23S rRNA (pseudouridine(1915)-N(3))-methyltransferase RlmH [bacterium]|nr:23S rRNA (pseudouridine(1915)-N(3))-methyltransferase RlmH [bacterium]